MGFIVKPVISECASLPLFFRDWQVNRDDLLITNQYILTPALGGAEPPCDVLDQERFGAGEPTDTMVDAMLSAVAGKTYQRVIAIGGGTVLDIAKLFVFGGGLSCAEIFEQGTALGRQRRLILIPTTCGTGSEVTGISIVDITKKHTKLGLAVPALFADEAVLIAGLLETMPYDVFAASSIDALIHAVESFISPRHNAFTRCLGRSAIESILAGYQALSAEPVIGLPADFRPYLTASTMAGLAFGNAGCGPVHALSYPIGAIYHVPHGKANYLLFQQVIAAYRRQGVDLSALENVLAAALQCPADIAWERMFSLVDRILPAFPLTQLGVDRAQCQVMAASVVANQQRLLANSPCLLTETDIEEIYLNCL